MKIVNDYFMPLGGIKLAPIISRQRHFVLRLSVKECMRDLLGNYMILQTTGGNKEVNFFGWEFHQIYNLGAIGDKVS